MDEKVSLKQLEIFESVVVAGSITRASRRIGLSQPSISQQLAKLEEELGAQLVLRKRSGNVELTSAGKFWFSSASDLLRRYTAALEDHATRFADGNITIRMGCTPTLRGRFAGAVARIALAEDQFARFEHIVGLNSVEIAERLRMHQLNCAVVNATSIEQDRLSYAITPLFSDTLAWVVPADLPSEALRAALAGRSDALSAHPELTRYVALGSGAPLQPASDDWYRQYLPAASPVFATTTYVAAVELVAEGLATAHCPVSLLPNLRAHSTQRLRWFEIDWLGRKMVLAMTKHLLTLPPYSRVHDKLEHFARTDYAAEMRPASLRPLAELF